MGFITFDWSQISYTGSPLMVPWWAQVHVFAGFVVMYWLVLPLLYYTNVGFPLSRPVLTRRLCADVLTNAFYYRSGISRICPSVDRMCTTASAIHTISQESSTPQAAGSASAITRHTARCTSLLPT